jgi:hypothetical protein
MAPKVAQVQELILLPLKTQERQQLIDLLAKLVSAQSSTGS